MFLALAASAGETSGRVYLRFFGWVGIASAIAVLVAPNFLSLLIKTVNDTFGTVFPAIPLAALLAVLFLLRWSDLRDVLLKEDGFRSEAPTRIVGLGIVVSPLLLRMITGQSMATAGVAVILVFYGTSLMVNPLTRRIMLPYAILSSVGVAVPTILMWGFGEPLAGLSATFSARLVSLAGIPVTWHGTQFLLLSRAGEPVIGAVTPDCSSIVSVTTFLCLLALMHFDLRKDLRYTAEVAAAGVAALVILNSTRIAILIWVGYSNGANALSSVHSWIGYTMLLGFYLVTLLVYPRMGRGTGLKELQGTKPALV
jgi:exosortase/archaeosortase family protein